MESNEPIKLSSIALVVGIYDMALGAWPLVSPTTFTTFTGVSAHLQPVMIIGALWCLMGAALLIFRGNPRAISLLSVTSMFAATSLALTEAAMILSEQLPNVFFLQVVLESSIAVSWLTALLSESALETRTKVMSVPHKTVSQA